MDGPGCCVPATPNAHPELGETVHFHGGQGKPVGTWAKIVDHTELASSSPHVCVLYALDRIGIRDAVQDRGKEGSGATSRTGLVERRAEGCR